MGALLLVVALDRTRAHDGAGDFDLEPGGRLRRTGPFVYTGAQILDPSGLAAIEEDVFSLNLYWNALAAEGRLYGLTYPGLWCDVGHPGGIVAAENLLRGGGDV